MAKARGYNPTYIHELLEKLETETINKINKKEFFIELNEIANTFEEWRYVHEKDNWQLHTGLLSEMAIECSKIAMERVKIGIKVD